MPPPTPPPPPPPPPPTPPLGSRSSSETISSSEEWPTIRPFPAWGPGGRRRGVKRGIQRDKKWGTEGGRNETEGGGRESG